MSVAAGKALPWWLRFLDYTNITTTSLTAAFILYTRSLGVLYFAAGAVSCSLSVKVIKRFVKQPRPVLENNGRRVKVTYGMPSTHSATITYYGVYTTLACYYVPLHPSIPSWIRDFAPTVLLTHSLLIALSRLWLGHHTVPQVLAGCAYGILHSLILFWVWTQGGRGLAEFLVREVGLGWTVVRGE